MAEMNPSMKEKQTQRHKEHLWLPRGRRRRRDGLGV